ncbi:MAG: hypothetical protein E5W21_06110 [Mesorhizobium sp.]|nr:MAG: hypothetical protein E5W21_06110 [Mesorhizobium sp.]
MGRATGDKMGRATLIGFSAVAMWASLALLTDASGKVPPFLLSAITFSIGTVVGLVARLFMPAAGKSQRIPPQVWLIGIAGLFGYHFFYFTALRNAPAVEASLIAYLWPLLIVLGSALMLDLDHALSLIEAVVGAVKVPVTVKMRLGWDEGALNAPVLARRAEQAGVRMVTVHGRTRCQFYQGKADWRAIARVKEAVSIPVVANGDVCSPAEASVILEQSGADAVMVGRAHYGAPWVAGSIATAAAEAFSPGMPETRQALADYVVAHYQDMLALYGIESGLRQARKHLGWYLDRHAGGVAGDSRKAIMTASEPARVVTLLREVFSRDPQTMNLRSAA